MKIYVNVPNPQNKSYKYFIEKSSTLIHKLLIGKGDARTRLRENEMLVPFVLALDVPDELIPLKQEILKFFSKKKAHEVGGIIHITSYQKSISSMRNTTASKIIDKIYTLHLRTKWASH